MDPTLPPDSAPRGRGSASNPPNRFEAVSFEEDPEALAEIAALDPDSAPRRPLTEFLRDESRSIITSNRSPDIGFDYSLNPYRGCEHGCSYCYARPYHEYLGFSAGLDFETKIVVKDVFIAWLERFAPGRRDLILGRIRELRAGALNDSRFGRRLSGSGPLAEQMRTFFEVARRRAGLESGSPPLSAAAFRRLLPGQPELF